MSTFLQQVAADLLQKHPGLKDLTIVLPSRRAAVFLKKELSKQIDRPVWSPKITTIEDFFMEALGFEQADQATLMFKLYESYSDVAGASAESFADFSQWAHLLLADFNEVDRYLVDARQIFSYLADVERIKKWDLQGGEMTELVQNYLKLWELLPALYRNFYQKLLHEKLVYQGIAYREMAENTLEHLPALKEESQSLAFVGFNALNTAEERILLQLYREGIARFYWDVDDYYFKDEDQEAGSFLRKSKLVRELIDKGDFYWRHNALAGIAKEVEIVNVNGNHLQAIAANAAVLRYREDAAEETAVVLADEELLQTFLNNLSEDVESLNVTMGLPLKGTPAAGFFIMLLEMLREQEHTGRKTGSGDPAYHYQKWDDLLGHFLFKHWSGNAAAVEELRLLIRQRNRVFMSAAELAEWQKEVFTPQMLAFFNGDYSRDMSSLWRAMAAIAEGLHLKDSGKNSLLQSLFGFFRTFNRLDDLMSTFPYVEDIKTATRFFRDLLGQETLDLQGDPLSGLQVMGMLESRALDFKNLILTSVNEDILPKGRSDNSLIPFDIKREFGLPTYLEKDAVFAYHFYRLLQRAEKVTLIYNGATEGLSSGEPSRFLKQLEHEFKERNKAASISIKNLAFDVRPEDMAEEEVEKTPAVMERLWKMAESGFSPTALIDYINDPVEFYKKRVLRLEEADEVEEVAGYDTQGNVVHELLEGFYSLGSGKERRPKDILQPEDPVFAQSEGEIRQQVVQWLEEKAHLRDLGSGKNLVIREILTGMIVNFLRKEKEELEKLRAQGQELEIVGLEQGFEASLSISGGRQVKIKGIIDRIDRVGNELRLIDYKTGFVKDAALKLKEMQHLRQPKDQNKSLQLMTYAWLYLKNHAEPQAVYPGIISLRSVNRWLMPLFYGKSRDIDAEVVEGFEVFLKELFEEIFDPAVPFAQKPLVDADE